MTMAGDHSGIVDLTHQMIAIAQRHNPQTVWLDFGTIQDDMSLQCDHMADKFPWKTYGLNADTMLFRDPLEQTLDSLIGVFDTGQASSGASLQHKHDIPRPLRLHPLQPGDRVLVALLEQESFAAVIMRIRIPTR